MGGGDGGMGGWGDGGMGGWGDGRWGGGEGERKGAYFIALVDDDVRPGFFIGWKAHRQDLGARLTSAQTLNVDSRATHQSLYGISSTTAPADNTHQNLSYLTVVDTIHNSQLPVEQIAIIVVLPLHHAVTLGESHVLRRAHGGWAQAAESALQAGVERMRAHVLCLVRGREHLNVVDGVEAQPRELGVSVK